MSRSFETGGAPHFPPHSSVAGVMLQVIYALVPAVAAHAWFFGPGILVQLILAIGFALGFEALMLKIRKQPVGLFLGDFSAVLTAILFALCVPPLAPWWIALFGMLFAIVIAKHLYGGLGHNMFNPAMVGYVVVLISFPQAMTAWLPPLSIAQDSLGLWDTLVTIFTGYPPSPLSWDAITEATPLDTIRTSIADRSPLGSRQSLGLRASKASTAVSESSRQTSVFRQSGGRARSGRESPDRSLCPIRYPCGRPRTGSTVSSC